MGAQLRVYRRRIRSVQSTKKITKAMELIASSRIVKAQQRLEASLPYLQHLYAAINAAATGAADVRKHPLMANAEQRTKAAVLVVTADRGLAGAYSSNAIKEAEALATNLREKDITMVPYVVGRKGVSYYRFRERAMGGEYTGFTDQPTYADARRIGDDLLAAFMTPIEEGGVDEIHIVYTHFTSMVSQEARIRRILPLEVVDEVVEKVEGQLPPPLYEFEPDAESVLDGLLPRYIDHTIYTSLLMSAASEHAARRRAMKSATDNAEEMIRSLSRRANQARQAEITQEISEIVGGADALSASR
ncbi:MAG: F0F1 ATP synthase subunit gamma [Actinomycetota bacterium]|nr:F0F1 ATP synthase subunit gamma [Actinomycetota bacterium]MDP1877729.1 F0F1 ATP synthase subunit gamma [Actinomycetota bacterium]